MRRTPEQEEMFQEIIAKQVRAMFPPVVYKDPQKENWCKIIVALVGVMTMSAFECGMWSLLPLLLILTME
jgi:hypothetical protein